MSYQGKSPSKPLKKTQLSEVFENSTKLVTPWNPIPTGFNNLDSVLNGGLIPQLYILGAESSAGKSTFMLNIAERIAQKNQPVMYFSLEMPADYIARLIICHSLLKQAGGFDRALMINNFTKNSGLERLKSIYGKKPDKDEKSPYDLAFKEYRELGRFIQIFERDKEHPNFSAWDIFNEVERELLILKNKGLKNQTPVVIVDYLQILEGEKGKNSSDQRAIVDYNVGMLSQITTELKVPVVAISSLNRGAYSRKREIETSDFKESGRIEYSADVLLALRSIGDPVGEIQRRTLMLSILKNRYGEKDTDVWLSFYPQFGLFEDGKRPENYEDLIKRENTPKSKTAAQDIAETRKEIETPNDTEDDTEDNKEYRRILNSRISVELHKNRNNYGFHGRLNIGGFKYFISYLLRKKSDENDGSDSLTLWDLAVMDAVYAVTDEGGKSEFTITELYKFMCGKSKLSHLPGEIAKDFRDALNRLKNREMIIDITDDIEMRHGKGAKKEPSASRKKRLFDWIEARPVTDGDELKALSESFGETEGRTLVKGTLLPFEESGNSYKLTRGDMPILFEYAANLCNEIIEYHPKLWAHIDGESQKNFTRQKLLIRYYLIREIGIMKYNHTKSHKVNADSLLTLLVLSDSSKLDKLEDKNIENLKSYVSFSRWRTSVSDDMWMILKDLKEYKYISGFKQIDKNTMRCDIK